MKTVVWMPSRELGQAGVLHYDKHVPMKKMAKIHVTEVRSALIYGSECWADKDIKWSWGWQVSGIREGNIGGLVWPCDEVALIRVI